MLGSASAMYGICLGSWYLLMPVLLADLFGTERISSSYGLVRMFQSVGAISVPPLAGFLRDLTGGYEICFYCMGTIMVLGSVPLLVSAMLYGAADEDGDNDDDAENSGDDKCTKNRRVSTASSSASQWRWCHRAAKNDHDDDDVEGGVGGGTKLS